MQDAGVGVGVERRKGVIFLKHRLELRDEPGEVLRLDGAVFEESDVLPIAPPPRLRCGCLPPGLDQSLGRARPPDR